MKPALQHTISIFYAAAAFFLLVLGIAIVSEKYYLLFLPFAALLFYTGWRSFPFIFLLLIASIPFSTEFQVSDSLGTDLPDEPLMLAVSGLGLFYIINNSKRLLHIVNHPLILCLFTLTCWTLISAMFSTHPVMSVKYLLAKTWYIGAFIIAALMVWTGKESLKRSGLVLAISMLIATLIILVRHGYEGFSFSGVSDVVQPFFRNHVNYSALLVCTLPLWFAGWKLSASATHRRIIVTILVVLLIALFFSYARGAWLALLTGAITYWLIRKRIVMRVMIAGIIVLSTAITWITVNNKYLDYSPDHNTTIFHEDFRQHLVATYEMKDMSAAERFYRWIAGFRMIPERPVHGFGPGTFYENYKPYTVPAFQTWVSDNPERSTVHNYFLLTAVEQGIPGLILLMILIAVVLYYSQKLFHRVNDPFYKITSIITGVIFSMILTLNFLSDLIETDKTGSIFFLCIAVLVVIDKQADRE